MCCLATGKVKILSTNQRTTCVAQTCRHPFRRLSTQKDECCETNSARTVPHHCLLNRPAPSGGNASTETLYEHICSSYEFEQYCTVLFTLLNSTRCTMTPTMKVKWSEWNKMDVIVLMFVGESSNDIFYIICCFWINNTLCNSPPILWWCLTIQ